MVRLTALGAAAALALVFPAAADEVVLKNGAVLDGLARERDDKVIVEMDFGTVTVNRSEVSSIKHVAGPLKELDERLKKPLDAKGHYETAQWAERQGLSGRAQELYRRVIMMDPGHEGARKALGYTKLDGRWLSHDEFMAAKGYVRHEGRWVTPEEREKELEAQEQRRLAEIRRQAAEEALRLQRELARLRLAQERVQLTTAQAYWMTYYQPWLRSPWTQNPVTPPAPFPYDRTFGQQLPLSGVPSQLPLSGVPSGLPLIPDRAPTTPPPVPPERLGD